MTTEIKTLIAFAIGVACGFFTASHICNQKKDEEIQELRDFYKSKYEPEEACEEKPETEEVLEYSNLKPDISEYSKIIKNKNYTTYSKTTEPAPENPFKDPYVIDAENFGQEYGYDTISVTYYKDGVLADFQDDEVEDLEATIGSDVVNQLEKSEEDVIYVRNERLKVDYEVIRDERTYLETVGEPPTEGE